MGLKFKLFFLFFFINVSLYSLTVGVVYDKLNKIDSEESAYILHIINTLEQMSTEKVKYTKILNSDFKISSFSNFNKYDLIIIITNISTEININFYDYRKVKLDSISLFISELFNNQNYDELNINSFTKKIIDVTDKNLSKIINVGSLKKNNNKNFNFKDFKPDFPFLSFGISGVSYKLLNDERPNIFSVFPINIIFSVYPISNFEIGVFYRFSYNSSIFIYKMRNDFKNYQKTIYFDMEYGLFTGYSFEYEKIIHSIGFSFYNKTFILEEKDDFKISNEASFYFIPQFSIYQKINIRLFKNLYYTIFINIKSSQYFNYVAPYFIANLFDYNIPTLEISFFGVSIIF